MRPEEDMGSGRFDIESGVIINLPHERRARGHIMQSRGMVQISYQEDSIVQQSELRDRILNDQLLAVGICWWLNAAEPAFAANDPARKQIQKIADLTGLKVETVADLMGSDWSFRMFKNGEMNFNAPT